MTVKEIILVIIAGSIAVWFVFVLIRYVFRQTIQRIWSYYILKRRRVIEHYDNGKKTACLSCFERLDGRVGNYILSNWKEKPYKKMEKGSLAWHFDQLL